MCCDELLLIGTTSAQKSHFEYLKENKGPAITDYPLALTIVPGTRIELVLNYSREILSPICRPPALRTLRQFTTIKDRQKHPVSESYNFVTFRMVYCKLSYQLVSCRKNL